MSPLLYYTKEQAKKLWKIYSNENLFIMDFAMRYGNPSIKSKIKKFNPEGCENLIIFTSLSSICSSNNSNCL